MKKKKDIKIGDIFYSYSFEYSNIFTVTVVDISPFITDGWRNICLLDIEKSGYGINLNYCEEEWEDVFETVEECVDAALKDMEEEPSDNEYPKWNSVKPGSKIYQFDRNYHKKTVEVKEYKFIKATKIGKLHQFTVVEENENANETVINIHPFQYKYMSHENDYYTSREECIKRLVSYTENEISKLEENVERYTSYINGYKDIIEKYKAEL